MSYDVTAAELFDELKKEQDLHRQAEERIADLEAKLAEADKHQLQLRIRELAEKLVKVEEAMQAMKDEVTSRGYDPDDARKVYDGQGGLVEARASMADKCYHILKRALNYEPRIDAATASQDASTEDKDG